MDLQGVFGGISSTADSVGLWAQGCKDLRPAARRRRRQRACWRGGHAFRWHTHRMIDSSCHLPGPCSAARKCAACRSRAGFVGTCEVYSVGSRSSFIAHGLGHSAQVPCKKNAISDSNVCGGGKCDVTRRKHTWSDLIYMCVRMHVCVLYVHVHSMCMHVLHACMSACLCTGLCMCMTMCVCTCGRACACACVHTC